MADLFISITSVYIKMVSTNKYLDDTCSVTGAYVLLIYLIQYYRKWWAAAHVINLATDCQPANVLMIIVLEYISVVVTKLNL